MSYYNKSFARKLTDDICDAIDYLCETFGYQISLHHIEVESCESWYRFLKYYYHQCPLCRQIKASRKAWRHCVDRQPKVIARVSESSLLGTCYAGVSEYVFPVKNISGHTRGFLCVSGYTLDRENSRERARAMCAAYGLSKEQVLRAVNKLDPNIPDLKTLTAQITPILDMLATLFYFNSVDSVQGKADAPQETLYQRMLHIANQNYRNPDFSLRHICDSLNVSYSYASHVFAEFNEVTYTRYIRRMRIETTKRYLVHSLEPIGFIASESGFSDSNYFSSIFKAETGMMPREFRRRYAISDAVKAPMQNADTDP